MNKYKKLSETGYTIKDWFLNCNRGIEQITHSPIYTLKHKVKEIQKNEVKVKITMEEV